MFDTTNAERKAKYRIFYRATGFLAVLIIATALPKSLEITEYQEPQSAIISGPIFTTVPVYVCSVTVPINSTYPVMIATTTSATAMTFATTSICH